MCVMRELRRLAGRQLCRLVCLSVRRLAAGGGAVLASAVLAACASSGGAFPTPIGDPGNVVAHASTMIEEASVAGADTLARDVMASARQHVADAQIELRDKHTARASLRAREAVADATYAKALADRIMAERSRSAEEALLQQLPLTPAAGTQAKGPGPGRSE
jgi:poly-gamma-glutamate capsule biosynthesis protein CapA/YwtB (metallophosphatase superfamily)